ncbi:hypothetical protein QBC34DRAFT_463613 [Podospora aff. communis PSN243]|uniref:Ecp2 effector protein domain-containing protein n=1 Tax=Podospora aff. communis PSN243 TaxID=3040156 RepID=A0AAV9GKH8_9PEZI|nr:hypothetical protein QBC34DRAFT_463613 [Podospora aff. communis PSN243]
MHIPTLPTLLLLTTLHWLTLTTANDLFQGNSILIRPSETSVYPKDANITSAHFYSYITDEGYFSFGWWLDATPTTNFTRCSPTQEYDWYEYSSSGGCNTTTGVCTVHALNYPAGAPTTADIDTNYVAWLVTVGQEAIGNLAVSYFDEAQGTFAVGSRRYLSGPGLGRDEGLECKQAYERLVGIQGQWNLPLKFKLTDPCRTAA